MNYEYMHGGENGIYDLKERLSYYADDILGVARMLDAFRGDQIDIDGHDVDHFLRMVILALWSISDSLDKEAADLPFEPRHNEGGEIA